MRIGVLSDTHGQAGTAGRALGLLRAAGAELVLHCGDIDDAETVGCFAGVPAHFVFGNCDYDHDDLRAAIRAAGAEVHEPFGRLELAGVRIAWLHGHDAGLKHELIHSGEADYLFYGHTHVPLEERVGDTWVINPGALFRAAVKTCLLLDLATGERRTIEVEPTQRT
jgi:putative phosphoesterase